MSRKVLISTLLVTLLLLSTAQTAEARIFRWMFGGRRAQNTAVVLYPEHELVYKIDEKKQYYGGKYSLQDIAKMRANWMAYQHSMDHGIHTYTRAPGIPAGVSEGIGVGGEKCGTCVTSRTVVADAETKSTTGATYRVRFFK